MRKKLLGAEHLYTITSMRDLAVTYHHQGKLKEAEQLRVQVLDIRKKLLGAEHPDTITSMKKLATIYHHQGKLKEAEQLRVQVLDIVTIFFHCSITTFLFSLNFHLQSLTVHTQPHPQSCCLHIASCTALCTAISLVYKGRLDTIIL